MAGGKTIGVPLLPKYNVKTPIVSKLRTKFSPKYKKE
jgi:hypothetical protein